MKPGGLTTSAVHLVCKWKSRYNQNALAPAKHRHASTRIVPCDWSTPNLHNLLDSFEKASRKISLLQRCRPVRAGQTHTVYILVPRETVTSRTAPNRRALILSRCLQPLAFAHCHFEVGVVWIGRAVSDCRRHVVLHYWWLVYICACCLCLLQRSHCKQDGTVAIKQMNTV